MSRRYIGRTVYHVPSKSVVITNNKCGLSSLNRLDGIVPVKYAEVIQRCVFIYRDPIKRFNSCFLNFSVRRDLSWMHDLLKIGRAHV